MKALKHPHDVLLLPNFKVFLFLLICANWDLHNFEGFVFKYDSSVSKLYLKKIPKEGIFGTKYDFRIFNET